MLSPPRFSFRSAGIRACLLFTPDAHDLLSIRKASLRSLQGLFSLVYIGGRYIAGYI